MDFAKKLGDVAIGLLTFQQKILNSYTISGDDLKNMKWIGKVIDVYNKLKQCPTMNIEFNLPTDNDSHRQNFNDCVRQEIHDLCDSDNDNDIVSSEDEITMDDIRNITNGSTTTHSGVVDETITLEDASKLDIQCDIKVSNESDDMTIKVKDLFQNYLVKKNDIVSMRAYTIASK